MGTPGRAREIRRRARSIRKAAKPELTRKDYVQRVIVVFIILAILVLAFFLTR